MFSPVEPCSSNDVNESNNKQTKFLIGKYFHLILKSARCLGLQSHDLLSYVALYQCISALTGAWIYMNTSHLVWCFHTFTTGSAIEKNDHSRRFMSTDQYAFTAEQFLTLNSVSTFHILLPHTQTWMALNSLKDRDSLPLNHPLRL